MNHTLTALLDSQRKPKDEPKREHAVRTLEKDFVLLYVIDTPASKEDDAVVGLVGIEFMDRNGHGVELISRVTGKPVALEDVLTPREIDYWTEEIQTELDEQGMRERIAAREAYEDGKGDWLYEQRKDREINRGS